MTEPRTMSDVRRDPGHMKAIAAALRVYADEPGLTDFDNGEQLEDLLNEAAATLDANASQEPEYALADLTDQPRPLMITRGARCVQYILVNEGDPKPYLIRERDLLPSDKPSVEIGTITVA